MKFLFDFDGVLTNQTEEALRVREIFAAEIARLGAASRQDIEAVLAQAERAMAEHPERHGWMSHGRVTAFANEDLFIRVNGLAACMDLWSYEGRSEPRALLSAIRTGGFEDFFSLAGHAYQEMVRETQSGKMKPLDGKTGPLFQRLIDRGHQAVIVSNSGTERILDLLGNAGVAAIAHVPAAHATPPVAPLRVRGGARKFELGDAPRSFDVDAYRVEISRPIYEEILREEKPQVVVGDVFSLDLALPLHLARTEPLSFGGMHLFLRTQPYTPDWSRLFVRSGREPHAKLHLLDDLQEIFDFLDQKVTNS